MRIDNRSSLSVPSLLDRLLCLRVDAVLKAHPNKPPLTFDAMLQLSSNPYHISEH